MYLLCFKQILIELSWWLRWYRKSLLKYITKNKILGVRLLYLDFFSMVGEELTSSLPSPACPERKIQFKLDICSSLVFQNTFHINISTCCSLGL